MKIHQAVTYDNYIILYVFNIPIKCLKKGNNILGLKNKPLYLSTYSNRCTDKMSRIDANLRKLTFGGGLR